MKEKRRRKRRRKKETEECVSSAYLSRSVGRVISGDFTFIEEEGITKIGALSRCQGSQSGLDSDCLVSSASPRAIECGYYVWVINRKPSVGYYTSFVEVSRAFV